MDDTVIHNNTNTNEATIPQPQSNAVLDFDQFPDLTYQTEQQQTLQTAQTTTHRHDAQHDTSNECAANATNISGVQPIPFQAPVSLPVPFDSADASQLNSAQLHVSEYVETPQPMTSSPLPAAAMAGAAGVNGGALISIGLDVASVSNLSLLLSGAIQNSFDFICTPMFPSPAPTAMRMPTICNTAQAVRTQTERSAIFSMNPHDFLADAAKWSSSVVMKVDAEIDLDSQSVSQRHRSEQIFHQQVSFASHHSLFAVLMPELKLSPNSTAGQKTGKGVAAAVVNCARNVFHSLSSYSQYMQYWMPIRISDLQSEEIDGYHAWCVMKNLCQQHRRLGLAIRLPRTLPDLSINPDCRYDPHLSSNELFSSQFPRTSPPLIFPPTVARWFGEPIRCVIIDTECFTLKDQRPALSLAHRLFLFQAAAQRVHFLLQGASDFDSGLVPYQQYLRKFFDSLQTPAHLASEQLSALFPPLSSTEAFSLNFRDYLQSPLQPLAENLESLTYETFEKDPVKYQLYHLAIRDALKDKILPHIQSLHETQNREVQDDAETSRNSSGTQPSTTQSQSRPVILIVLGAGRGPLVRCALSAADALGAAIRVYAVEKNPNAVITLGALLASNSTWHDRVEIVHADMRSWRPKAFKFADMVVSELLGSFGDNELSPECLDGAERFLHPTHGLSIPAFSLSFVTPISSSKLWYEVTQFPDSAKALETPYVCKLHQYFPIAAPKSCFAFGHPKRQNHDSEDRHFIDKWEKLLENLLKNAQCKDEKKDEQMQLQDHSTQQYNISALGISSSAPLEELSSSSSSVSSDSAWSDDAAENRRHCHLSFVTPVSITVHGFAGYFAAQLYDRYYLSIEPRTASSGMFSWFPMYFPIRTPVQCEAGDRVDIDLWRCTSSSKVWYEWTISAPQALTIHNASGRSYSIGLV